MSQRGAAMIHRSKGVVICFDLHEKGWFQQQSGVVLMKFPGVLLSFWIFCSLVNWSVAGVETGSAQGSSHVGEIRYSILHRDQFRKLYGEHWDLLQGQSLEPDSELSALWGKQELPDARGLFLRCSNAGRDPQNGNPENVGVGTVQRDTFKTHNHGGGDHGHVFYCEQTASRQAHGRQEISNTMAVWHEFNRPYIVNNSGKIIHNEGGCETRPRCLTVNAFIQLRESAEVSVQSDESSDQEKRSQWLQSAEFQEAVTEVVRRIVNQRR